MDLAAYEAENIIEASHWWYVGRRSLFLRYIRKLGIAKDAAILDIGTSTGTNLRMLKDAGYTNVTGMDISPVAAQYCASKGLGKVEIGDVCALPFAEGTFDFILATDIIEHVDDDALALSEISRVLKTGGSAVFTVPAFQELWGTHDTFNHHKRRYHISNLNSLIGKSGLAIRQSYYFNYILFIPIFLARKFLSRANREQGHSELLINNPVLNWALLQIFSFDLATARYVHSPFGVSAFSLATKTVARE